MKIERPWKATKMVKMNARAKSSSTSITRTPMIQVMPITTVKEMEAFDQFLCTINKMYVPVAINISDSSSSCYICTTVSYSLPNLLEFIFVLLGSVMIFILDNKGHYKESNVSQQDQNHWENERPNK